MPRCHDCQAVAVADQMICQRCRLVWDINDPEPPDCVEPSTVNCDVELASKMLRAYKKSTGGIPGMLIALEIARNERA